MPAQGGHFDSAYRELLACSWLCVSFFGSSSFSFCFLGGISFFFFGGLCSSFVFFAHGGWLSLVGHFAWLAFAFHFSFCSWCHSGRCSSSRCGGSSWCSHCGRSSRLGSRGLGECTSSEETRDQDSKDFVHLDFPEITLLEKVPRRFRRHPCNEAGLCSVDNQTIFLCCQQQKCFFSEI